MNYVRKQDKTFRTFTLMMAMIALFVLAGAAIPAQAQTPTTIYSFTASPPGPLNPNVYFIAQGRDGNLYLTAGGGDGDAVDCTTIYCGEAFFITPSGSVTELFDFSNTGCPGAFCGAGAYGGLILGTDGNYYGATQNGGTTGNGTVFKLTPAGVATALYNFTGSGDGSHPYGSPIQATNGTFYGTTQAGNSTAYSVTSAGVFKTLHTFTGTDGQSVYAPLIQGTDGNFYGDTAAGGTSNNGVIFKMTSSGTVTVLHNFTGTDGSNAYYPLIQASDGNLYGSTYNGGSSNAGVIFKITPAGTYTVLHNMNGSTDGSNPAYALVQATNGKLHGVGVASVAQNASASNTIFSITTTGTFTTLYTFTGGADGGFPLSPMRQHTNGLLYGTTDIGGSLDTCSTNVGGILYLGCGTVFSLDIGANAFITLQSTSGKVGSQVNIFGQGFSSSSVVKFNGVQATKTTLTGTTYITATVPTSATNGFVTVTTGTNTLTSTQKYTVHNSWSQGAVMPVATEASGAGFISGKIYVVGGSDGTTAFNNNQIYNTANNKWTTGGVIPTAVWAPASAVASGLLYVFGGYEASGATNLVQAYNPTTNTWSTKSPMPTARGSAAAVVDGSAIYVIGGNGSTNRLNTVEKYVPSIDTWTEEAPLLVGKSEPTAGLLGTTIVSADGYTASEDTGDNEEYNVSTNTWSALAADPTPRNADCFGAISGLLYVAGGGSNGTAESLTESFSATTNKWTTLLAMPQSTIFPTPAVANGVLYCFGGSNVDHGTGTIYNLVQIYQP